MIDVYRHIFTTTFTALVLLVGLFVAVITRLFFLDPAMPIIGVFHTTFWSWDNEGQISDRDFGPLGLMTAIGLAGLAIMWVSSRLDFVDRDDDMFTSIAVKGTKLTAVVWALAFFMSLGSISRITVSPDQGLVEMLVALLEAAVYMAVDLVALAVMVPFSLLWMVFPVLCLAWAIGGALSAGRALIFLVTRHRLRGAYERGQRRATFNASEVEQNLGSGSTSQAEARAFLKDAVSLLATARKRAEKLNEELDGLSQKVRDDAERLEVEAELSQTLAEIEEMKIKIDALKRRTGGRA